MRDAELGEYYRKQKQYALPWRAQMTGSMKFLRGKYAILRDGPERNMKRVWFVSYQERTQGKAQGP